MFKTLFLIILFVTLAVNILFLVTSPTTTTKEKPPDESSTMQQLLLQKQSESIASSQRRLFLRSNDFYDYSAATIQSLVASNSMVDSSTMTPAAARHDNERQVSGGGGYSKSVGRAVTTVPSKATSHDEYYIVQQQMRPSKEFAAGVDSELPAGYLHSSDRSAAIGNEKKMQSDEDEHDTDANANANANADANANNELSDRKVRVLALRGWTTVNHTSSSIYSDSSRSSSLVDERTKSSIMRRVLRPKRPSSVNQDKRDIADDDDAFGYDAAQSRQQFINATRGGADNKHDDGSPIGRDRDRNSNSNSTKRQRTKPIIIRVKSSRNHVFVSVDNNVIHESKSAMTTKLPPSPALLSNYDASSAGDDNGVVKATTTTRTKRLFDYPIARQSQANELASVPPPPPLTTSSTAITTDDGDADGRGIHVIVLNERDARVMARRVFDTYSPTQDEELCHFIGMIRDGRLLIFAVKDEASFKMPASSAARVLLQKLGSRRIMDLRWRDMWAFVVRKTTLSETNLQLGESSIARRQALAERTNLAEGLTKSSRFSDWAPALMLEVSVELITSDSDSTSGPSACKWTAESSSPGDEDKRRAEFCSRVEGYGQVCECQFPAPISFEPKQLDQVPIVVMAGNRPYYLYRMLRSLLAARGLNHSMVTVFIDGFYDEPLMVARLFNLRVVQQKPRSRRSARISHHYRSSLSAAFQLFPRAEHVIIFEEDLDIAEDALVYFNQTLELLKSDASLYCVSAWNDQGYEHTAADPKLVYRIETMPGLGWMLSRKLYKDELEPNWPSVEQQHDWDMWIRTSAVRKQRECLIPDVSRTFHFGATGTNINSYFQRQYFSHHAFNLEPQDEFENLTALSKEPYEALVEQLIRTGQVLSATDRDTDNATEYLCSLATRANDSRRQVSAASERHHQRRANVIYIKMIDKRDFGNWLKLARCWQIWDLDARGQHNSMWRLFLGGVQTLVIGAPASPYSYLMPPHSAPFKLSAD